MCLHSPPRLLRLLLLLSPLLPLNKVLVSLPGARELALPRPTPHAPPVLLSLELMRLPPCHINALFPLKDFTPAISSFGKLFPLMSLARCQLAVTKISFLFVFFYLLFSLFPNKTCTHKSQDLFCVFRHNVWNDTWYFLEVNWTLDVKVNEWMIFLSRLPFNHSAITCKLLFQFPFFL